MSGRRTDNCRRGSGRIEHDIYNNWGDMTRQSTRKWHQDRRMEGKLDARKTPEAR